ncbi:MFS transporter, partial [Corynebacterium heidelbergense]
MTDRHIAARIWPLLLVAALGLAPFTVFSNFLVDIATDAGSTDSAVGSLRGLGGVAAILVGVLCAPLIDALSRPRLIACAAAVLGVGCAISTVGSTWAWVAFCVLIGAGTAILNPAVSAQASDTFTDKGDAGRAATLVSSTMTLTAMLAAPLLAGPALWWGWRGNMVALGLAFAAGAVVFARGGGSGRAGVGVASPRTRRYPGLAAAAPLLAVSTLRTAAFMGQLAFVASLYHERFGLGPEVFAWVWSLSGLSFFLVNFGG